MPKVFGICTDVLKEDGQEILKDGKRIHGAIGWYRIINPLEKLGYETTIGLKVSANVQSALELKEKGDIWMCKMTDNENIDFIYGAHAEVTGCKFVLDLDDDPDNVDPDHPDYDELLKRRDMRIRMIKVANHIIVSTEGIKQAIKHINPHVTVIPNAIDPKIWEVQKPKKRDDGIIRIGWISSGSHFADLPVINPVLDALKIKYPQIEIHFAGMVADNTGVDREYHHRGTNGYQDFPQWYSYQDYDIAIAPLKDTQFNRCKSNIKWMEASMLGIPCVASDVEPYRCIVDGKTGYKAKNTNQFIKYLSWLIESEELRKKIGQQAREEVLKNWTIDKFLPKYTELFEKLAEKKDITVITAIAGGKDKLKEQPAYPGVEYVAFVDDDVKSETWKTRKVCDKFVKPVMNAKIHKILAHKYVNTPYIVWIDGSITLKKDPHELVKLMGKKHFAFFKHPGRDCLYEEASACIGLKKGEVTEISEQVKEYARDGVKEHSGLWECTAFIRDTSGYSNLLFEKWWVEVSRYSERDQISFPVVFGEVEKETIPGSVEQSPIYEKVLSSSWHKNFPGNEYFKFKKHIKK